MATIAPISPNTVHNCPHGLPFGACPVCSGMGGGGAKTAKKTEPPKNQMSYGECYAVWMRMKAADRRKLEAENNIQRQAEFLQNSKQMLNQVSERLLSILNKIQNILPLPLAGVFGATVNNILKPLLNIIQNFPNFVNNMSKFVQNIQREIYIVAEKLAGVFGEIKNFIQKQVSETFKKFTKKVYKILNIFGLRCGEDGAENFDEDEKVNAEIAAFKAKDVVSIKEFLISLIRTERKPKDDNNDKQS